MIYHKFKKIIFVLLIILNLLLINVYADNTWTYKIIEKGNDSTEEMIDINNSTVDIDYDLKEIRLQKKPLPNIADYMPGGAYNYALLQEDGIHQYVFNGEKLIEVESLHKQVDNPLALAVSPFPYNITVSMAEDNNSNNMMHYTLEQGTMVNNPTLNMVGLQQIYSMASFKDSGDLAVLVKDELNIYASDVDRLIPISNLKVTNINNPIAVATASNYNFAVLDKENITWHSYDGSKMVQIPALSITIDKNIKEPKGIAIKDDRIYFLHDEELTTYKYDLVKNEMAVFSITRGFTKPHALALRPDSSDLIIIDEVNSQNKDYRIRYMMYDGENLVENQTLSQVLKGIMAGLRYYGDGELVLNAKTATASYADYIRVRAYTDVPPGSQITFYIANEGETFENAIWHESWKIKNTTGIPKVEKAILKNNGEREWKEYGAIEKSYPSFDTMPNEDNGLVNDEDLLITEDEGNLNIEITKEKNQLLNLWNIIPNLTSTGKSNDKYKNVRIKAVLKTNNSEVTPKIYVPNGSNNEGGVNDPHGRAMVWEANAIPEPPVIKPIKPEHGDPDNYSPVPGWIYTTTPDVEWEFKDADKTINPEHKQVAYQVIMLAKNTEGNWKIVFDTRKIIENEGEETILYTIPTSDKANSEGGPMWVSDSYEFAVAVRTWDIFDAESKLSVTKSFKVLAFERPRISNIVNPPSNEGMGIMSMPTSNDKNTHYLITSAMKAENLPFAKAGAQVTMLIDSVGPIDTNVLVEDISYVYFIGQNGEEIEVDIGECKRISDDPAANISPETKNRYLINFWTKAPITEIPNDTLVKMKLVGESELGGTTVFYIPPYADGIVVTKDTIYEDWHVVLEGSEK